MPRQQSNWMTWRDSGIKAVPGNRSDQRLEGAPGDLPLGQREAITFAAGSDQIAYISRERSEGRGSADLYKVEFSLSEPAPHTPAALEVSR